MLSRRCCATTNSESCPLRSSCPTQHSASGRESWLAIPMVTSFNWYSPEERSMATTASASTKRSQTGESRSAPAAATMKAIAVIPGQPNTMHVRDVPRPSIDEIPGGRGVLVKVLRVGVDGTDKEINAAEYGAAPLGFDYRI